MKSNLDPQLIELEAKIQILEFENEFLSAKAQENLLLNRAFEGINIYEDIDFLFLNTLENISVLLDIQFSGIFDFDTNAFNCIASYALFENEDTNSVYFNVSEELMDRLRKNEPCVASNTEASIVFEHPNKTFKPDSFLIIPLNSEVIQNRFFVFINDENGDSLYDRVSLFDKIIKIISAKLEKIFYQNELKRLNEELERKVDERTFELKRQNEEYASLNEEYKTLNEELCIAKEKAEECDRLKSSFLANMSHEIRTPMNGILGFAELLKEKNLTGEQRNEYIGIIEKSGDRMLNIINDIIDISKIESGQMDISVSATNINEQIEYLYSFFKPEVDKKGMQLIRKNSLPVNSAIINTDREKLYAILTNLVKNAIKYTNAGFVEFGYDKKDKNILFYVKDSGIGIAKDRMTAVFERFIQADYGHSRSYQGAGLGLSISKAYVEMLGGKIWMESEPGKGSCFYFTIPLNMNELAKPLKNDEFPNQTKGSAIEKIKILVAEDDEASSMLISAMLEDINCEILYAKTGLEIIEICRNNPETDLILMDIQLPGLNGYEATKQIREFNTKVKIIAQTAYALAGDREKAINAGCNDYASKPISRKSLIGIINKFFSKSA